MSYRAIIFDFFGVFTTDVYQAWLTANIADWQTDANYYHTLSRDSDSGRISKDQLLTALGEKAGLAPQAVANGLNNFALDQHMISLLTTVAVHYKTALLCNGTGAIIRPILEEQGMLRRFKEVIFSSEVGLAKPQPEIYQLALQRLNVSASETLFIDDRPTNIAGAQALGITSILYQGFPQLQTKLHELDIL